MPGNAEAAKAYNRQVRITVEAIGGSVESDKAYGFICECGCGETAMLTLHGYDRNHGALLVGHEESWAAPKPSNETP